MNKNNPKTRDENIVVQEMEKELLIYDLNNNKAFCLNETSALIYLLCDGTQSITEISQSLSRKLNEAITEDLVWLALDQFKRDNLLSNNEQFEINFNGLSRRQIIKKVGLTSLVTLPIIASVTAPAAGATASDPRNCYAPLVGVCMMAAAEVCPVSCPPGTPIMLTIYGSGDTTCSGGAVGSGSGGCPSGPIGFPYIIDNF